MKSIKVTALTTTLLFISGCAGTYNNKNASPFDVRPTPPVHILEVDDNIKDPAKINFKINDQTVYKFSYLVEDTMRKRVDHARKWEEGMSSIQVLFAALASVFSAATGVHPDVVTTLSGLSALTPDLSNIINAGEKSKAYAQGLDLIESANSTYLQERVESVKSNKPLIPDDTLTPEGAALFVSVMSTLKIMRDALLQTIPSQTDLAKATGKYNRLTLDTNLVEINITKVQGNASLLNSESTAIFTLNDEGKKYFSRTISVVKGDALKTCVSDSPNIVKVTACSGNIFTLEPMMQGEANITVVNESGNKASVTVKILR
ncbi:hypothetical protein PEC301653_17370 [Pectobacterium carotovorum subsp. carotovorum]|uniref:hypothetical protein n=1 Tax=Pectobacterium carotovorum TaxID=554 RepID=UPI00027E0857|nr:hypothetical protein [Pectobacterium carotovorum]AFR03669.1 hypothetical protein PCC21_022660 [Pectobacterium carotovorum subsp. carotovorum PCC21]GKV98691.1 hypothetical protein PEC301653_17370 [Pectobacterium carotovorum subsp. carotovorum]